MRRPAAAPLARALCAVLLASAAPAAAQHAFTWDAPDRGDAVELQELRTFYTDFVNTGSVTSDFRLELAVEAPPDWVSSMCEGVFCYAPFVREFDFTLAPGDTNHIGANVTPLGDLGGARLVLTATCLDDPSLTATRSFVAVTPGLDVLIVDADAGADPVPATVAALGATGKSSVAWPTADAGAPAADVLGRYATVVWSAGSSVTGLDEAGRTALDQYAQQGGHVWLNGANLAFSQCSPASPAYSPAALAWCRDVAGVDWLAISAGSTTIVGVPGDELGDGLALTLNGGDSASNNASPDELAAYGGGTAALAYGTGDTAGVRRVWGAGRIVTTGFTLEGVETADQRAGLAAAVLGWFVGGASAAGDAPAAAALAPRAVPNPFNPRTTLAFAVPEGGAAAKVTIHDLRGRLVRRLFAGRLDGGARQLAWDGRDGAGRALAGGVYLARVRVGEAEAAIKLTILK